MVLQFNRVVEILPAKLLVFADGLIDRARVGCRCEAFPYIATKANRYGGAKTN